MGKGSTEGWEGREGREKKESRGWGIVREMKGWKGGGEWGERRVQDVVAVRGSPTIYT
jgi:hypothetical protein